MLLLQAWFDLQMQPSCCQALWLGVTTKPCWRGERWKMRKCKSLCHHYYYIYWYAIARSAIGPAPEGAARWNRVLVVFGMQDMPRHEVINHNRTGLIETSSSFCSFHQGSFCPCQGLLSQSTSLLYVSIPQPYQMTLVNPCFFSPTASITLLLDCAYLNTGWHSLNHHTP